MLSSFVNAIPVFADSGSLSNSGYSFDSGNVNDNTNQYPNQAFDETSQNTLYFAESNATQTDDPENEIESFSIETMSTDPIEIEPKPDHKPLAKPGVGGWAAIPSLIGAIVGPDDFCSVWNTPFNGLCFGYVQEDGTHIDMPLWCHGSMSLPYCADYVKDENQETIFNKSYCFDENWNHINCRINMPDQMCGVSTVISNGGIWIDGKANSLRIEHVPCNTIYVCHDINGLSVNCNLGPRNQVKQSTNHYFTDTHSCYTDVWERYGVRKSTTCHPEILNVDMSNVDNEFGNHGYHFDSYSRVINSSTGMPVTNDKFYHGYPRELSDPNYEPPEDDSTPIPIPDGESCGIICDWLQTINSNIVRIDTHLLSFLDYFEDVSDNMNSLIGEEIIAKFNEIITAIDEISVEIVKEAGTNFWDVLGGAFGDIFDLIEFLIEKIIYLVIPEDTTSIRNAFDLLQTDLESKVAPVHEIQSHITGSIPTEQKEFEDLTVTLPQFGTVKFFNTEYLGMAMPYIRALLGAMMVLFTSIWAYRKVSSEMIR